MHHQVVTFHDKLGIRNEGFYVNRHEAEMDAEYSFPEATRRAVLDVDVFEGLKAQYRVLYQDGIDYKWTKWDSKMPSHIKKQDIVKIEAHAVRDNYTEVENG